MFEDQVIWCLFLIVAIFYVASCFVLRLCCMAANRIGSAVGDEMYMRVPGYAATAGALFVASFAMAMLDLLFGTMLTPFAGDLFAGPVVRTLTMLAQGVLFAVVIAEVIRSDRHTPFSLALLASMLYILVLFGVVCCCRMVIMGM